MDHRLVKTKIPDVKVFEGTRTKISLKDASKGKRIVLFGVPGAFTPGCSEIHLPGFMKNIDELRSLGVEDVFCVAVSDAFVMDAWAKQKETKGKVRMLADVQRKLTQKLGMEVDLTKMLGSIRSRRYSCIIEDGIITHFNEEYGNGISSSNAETIISQLKRQQAKL